MYLEIYSNIEECDVFHKDTILVLGGTAHKKVLILYKGAILYRFSICHCFKINTQQGNQPDTL